VKVPHAFQDLLVLVCRGPGLSGREPGTGVQLCLPDKSDQAAALAGAQVYPQPQRGRGKPMSGEAKCGLSPRTAARGCPGRPEGRCLTLGSWPRPDSRPAPPPGAPGWPGPRATRGDLPRAASLEPLPGPAPGGQSGKRQRGRRRRQGATPPGAPPREAPRPSSSDHYPFQENTVLQREASFSL
jgi:hypothetical protein